MLEQVADETPRATAEVEHASAAEIEAAGQRGLELATQQLARIEETADRIIAVAVADVLAELARRSRERTHGRDANARFSARPCASVQSP